jgi:hypothetical protein
VEKCLYPFWSKKAPNKKDTKRKGAKNTSKKQKTGM